MKNIYKALAGFQQDCPTIHKGTKGYGYSYADLPAIFEVINPILKNHGLGFTQLIESQTIKTVLFHLDSGETIESSTDIIQGVQLAKMNEFQVLGSAITYIRRYALSSMLGIVTDIDADGNTNKEPLEDAKGEKQWLNENSKEWIGGIEKGSTLETMRKYFKISKVNADKYTESLKNKS